MTTLDQNLDKLASFEPADLPVISLYLNAEVDQRGKRTFGPFVRKELPARAKTFKERSPERESFERDIERIEEYLQGELHPSTHGLAVFACSGVDFFEAIELAAPVGPHAIFVGNRPHLYVLARINDQFPRYAALLTNTNSARLFVFGLHQLERTDEVHGVKTNRTDVGGWSQARYQRHVENIHLHHAKEVIEALDRTVRQEKIEHVILSGDEVIVPILREQMPKHLQEKVIDVLHLDIRTPEHEVLEATLNKMRERDSHTDAEKVERLLGDYRAGGLAVVGVCDTQAALGMGQVDELVISATPDAIETSGDMEAAALADALVTAARQTAATVTFIENTELLAGVGGVGAFLRYRI